MNITNNYISFFLKKKKKASSKIILIIHILLYIIIKVFNFIMHAMHDTFFYM